MIGKDRTFPKRARYPLFLAGLVVIICGGIGASATGASPATIGELVLAGFALMALSVIVR